MKDIQKVLTNSVLVVFLLISEQFMPSEQWTDKVNPVYYTNFVAVRCILR
jgi:hypothetical protein